MTPISLFTAMMLTSSVGTASASRERLRVEQPVRADRQEDRLEPFRGEVGDALQHAFMLGRDGDDAAARIAACASAWRAAPLMARLFASVAPEVRMISRGSAPISAATSARAASTAASASRPSACSALCGLPKRSVNQGSIASTTRGSQGVVAWLSR